MNVLAICGAANKRRNTATMLKSAFDVEMVNQRHAEQFPKDCKDAFDMGKRLAESI